MFFPLLPNGCFVSIFSFGHRLPLRHRLSITGRHQTPRSGASHREQSKGPARNKVVKSEQGRKGDVLGRNRRTFGTWRPGQGRKQEAGSKADVCTPGIDLHDCDRKPVFSSQCRSCAWWPISTWKRGRIWIGFSHPEANSRNPTGSEG